ncbi:MULTISPECIES: hypothetical protein [Kribbella]|uniref:hypothetical protein n=1 Tax=Kribbella TaxID=182639 RepID=UPI001046CB66|nr:MULTISPECIES: hypothetical protein [Kribbella]
MFAIEELIEDETLAVERLVGRWKWPDRSGYVEGVFATLAWVWRRSGAPQIAVERATAPFRLPSMASELNDSETVLTGLLKIRLRCSAYLRRSKRSASNARIAPDHAEYAPARTGR